MAILFMAVTLSCSLVTRFFSQGTKVIESDAPQGLIAYVGSDNNIYTIDRLGQQQRAITRDARPILDPNHNGLVYRYPTWAPNGRILSFIAITSLARNQLQAYLYIASSDGKEQTKVFSSQEYFPFYLFWSPDSAYITFLSNQPNATGLALHLAPTAGGESKIIGTGQPFYWDWSPDSQAIFMHTGGASANNPMANLTLLELDGSLESTQLALSPGYFQAPDWSPVGDRLLMAVENEAGESDLVVAGRNGENKQLLAQLNGAAAFAWSPKGDRLVYADSIESDATDLIKRLVLLDPAQPEQDLEIARGALAAFFWSPDSQKIVFFTVDLEQPGRTFQSIAFQQNAHFELTARVYDLLNRDTLQIYTFEPTESFVQVMVYYDQYQRSGTIWSPDSQELVLSGIDINGDSNIFVVRADGSLSRKIAKGDLAFWSWK